MSFCRSNLRFFLDFWLGLKFGPKFCLCRARHPSLVGGLLPRFTFTFQGAIGPEFRCYQAEHVSFQKEFWRFPIPFLKALPDRYIDSRAEMPDRRLYSPGSYTLLESLTRDFVWEPIAIACNLDVPVRFNFFAPDLLWRRLSVAQVITISFFLSLGFSHQKRRGWETKSFNLVLDS